jgi:hemerythrin
MKLNDGNNNFSADVRVIFNRHDDLIKALEKIVYSDNFSVRSDIVSETFSKIIQYFEFFNNFEKQHLKHHKYPHYEKQAQQYKKFLNSYTMLSEEMATNKKAAKNDFILLSRDLYKHLTKFSAEYGQYVGEIGIPRNLL